MTVTSEGAQGGHSKRRSNTSLDAQASTGRILAELGRKWGGDSLMHVIYDLVARTIASRRLLATLQGGCR